MTIGPVILVARRSTAYSATACALAAALTVAATSAATAQQSSATPQLPAAAQQPAGGDSVADFLRVVRSATERYHDRSNALADGYRKVGPDFPGMGEHWVQPGRLASGRFVAHEPPILTYISVDGAPVLTGAVFAQPLGPRELPPSFPSRDAWHDHSASVDEESLLIAPAGHAHMRSSSGAAPRLAMLHAWVWTENPDGVFAQDNWALPWERLQIAPPAAADPLAARALSFAAGGDRYFTAFVAAAAPLHADEERRLDILTSTLQTDVTGIVAALRAGEVAPQQIEPKLTQLWRAFWTAIESAVSEQTWQRLQPFAPAHH